MVIQVLKSAVRNPYEYSRVPAEVISSCHLGATYLPHLNLLPAVVARLLYI